MKGSRGFESVQVHTSAFGIVAPDGYVGHSLISMTDPRVGKSSQSRKLSSVKVRAC